MSFLENGFTSASHKGREGSPLGQWMMEQKGEGRERKRKKYDTWKGPPSFCPTSYFSGMYTRCSNTFSRPVTFIAGMGEQLAPRGGHCYNYSFSIFFLRVLFYAFLFNFSSSTRKFGTWRTYDVITVIFNLWIKINVNRMRE